MKTRIQIKLATRKNKNNNKSGFKLRFATTIKKIYLYIKSSSYVVFCLLINFIDAQQSATDDFIEQMFRIKYTYITRLLKNLHSEHFRGTKTCLRNIHF